VVPVFRVGSKVERVDISPPFVPLHHLGGFRDLYILSFRGTEVVTAREAGGIARIGADRTTRPFCRV
jgi:hypothetical protein